MFINEGRLRIEWLKKGAGVLFAPCVWYESTIVIAASKSDQHVHKSTWIAWM